MKKIKIILFLGICWFVIHSFFIIFDGLRDEKLHGEIAVILGNKVNKDGSLSKRLEKRLECGLELFNQKRVNKILVSGGLGKEGHYEGTVMKAFFFYNGIPDSLILVDNNGNNTELTAINSKKISKQYGFNQILVVSQYYHITRTKMLFQKQGFTNISSVSPMYFEWRDFYAIFREFIAFYIEII